MLEADIAFGTQSLREIKAILEGPRFRTVRTIQFIHSGPDEVTFRKIQDAANHVIDHINYGLKYVDGFYHRVRTNTRRTIHPITNPVVQRVMDEKQGSIACYGDTPKSVGQVSRFGMAWWDDKQEIKTVRIFGDRIHLNCPHPEVPRLIPFGQEPYYIVFETKDPYHCLKCRTPLKTGEGIWIGTAFVCNGCKYQTDSGFLPGINRVLSKKKRRHT